MATIEEPKLTIPHDHNKKIAHPHVEGRVRFTSNEMTGRKNGVAFRMDCELWADDPYRDDHLCSFGSQFLPIGPADTVSETETFEFDTDVGLSLLNEDWGTDEIYGIVKIRNLDSEATWSRKTNVFSHKF